VETQLISSRYGKTTGFWNSKYMIKYIRQFCHQIMGIRTAKGLKFVAKLMPDFLSSEVIGNYIY
jgi:hypothetical protein